MFACQRRPDSRQPSDLRGGGGGIAARAALQEHELGRRGAVVLLGRGEGAHHDEPTPLVVALAVELERLVLLPRDHVRVLRRLVSVHGVLLTG